MNRRDLIIYVLIALVGMGGAAVVSALASPSPFTPFLLWAGVSAMFISGIGLLVMLITAPPTFPRDSTPTTAPLPPLSSGQLHHLLWAAMFFMFVLAMSTIGQLLAHHR